MHSNQINLARHLALGIEENWQFSPQRVIYKPLFILMPREVETGKRPDFITHTKKKFYFEFLFTQNSSNEPLHERHAEIYRKMNLPDSSHTNAGC